MTSSSSSTSTSSAATATQAPDGRAAAAPPVEPTGFLRRHGFRLALIFVGVLLPLSVFGALAEDVHERELIVFDQPLLLWAHSLATPALDRFFVGISAAGYASGVVPFDVVLVLILAWKRRPREALFAALAIVGALLLNLGAKYGFARMRPALWESITPLTTYSFPSGHAMGSATLACVLIALAWRTRWRWPVAVAMTLFAFAVGVSRVYLGVHYPSDILAGWSAAGAWTLACYLVTFRRVMPWALPVPAVPAPTS